MAAPKPKTPSGIERRKSRRRPILESFSFFVVVPKKGYHRLNVMDLSDTGVGFDFDIGGESSDDFPVAMGEQFDLQFYVNQSLYLPLKVKVMRIDQVGDIRRIGAEFLNANSKEYQALKSVLQMIDTISDAAHLVGAE